MNLEERQYCRQIYHFLNIDKENKLGGKHAVLFKSLLSLLGEPTWSQSLAEIHRIFTSLKTKIFLGKNALLSSRFVCEILTHQEMAPSWVSTHKNIHAKDKPAQPICPPPAQPAAFPSDLLRPSPKYRGTSGFPVSLTSNTFLKKKKKNPALFLIECHSGRKTGLQYLNLPVPNTWSLVWFGFVLNYTTT